MLISQGFQFEDCCVVQQRKADTGVATQWKDVILSLSLSLSHAKWVL